MPHKYYYIALVGKMNILVALLLNKFQDDKLNNMKSLDLNSSLLYKIHNLYYLNLNKYLLGIFHNLNFHLKYIHIYIYHNY